ncbi:protein VASCULAR ASSOCIATED DEATH 1, chloroplastic [Andrographis paniculata]|uniref:protein VASCULAR ASSOCIATED DEATH 1, chloroplastic n=1 Tax=Andrographis paniculata TaxID=175694 RepID=UPI0021E9793A|nr:protein VASCULAR ASSOCIATED DEATH 1, chloroplastic [Andrographis paniculata]
MAAVDSEKMAGPTPTPAPPVSQSMENLDPSKSVSGDSPSRSPDRLPLSTSRPPKELDSQNQSPSRVEEYRQLFRLPQTEVLIQDFNCALQENFLIQGHMYLFVHHICFYSNLFGFETKKIIAFDEISYVRRAKAVGVFPTAIEIIAGGKKYFFTSFLFRDEAFKLINEGWLQHSNGNVEITDQLEDSKSDISIQENGSSIVEESSALRRSVDELDIIDSDKSGPILEESKSLADGEPEIVPVSADVEVREEVKVEAVNECSSSDKISDWVSTNGDAPGVPEGFTKVAESQFPIGVKEFFNLFFSDDGVKFHESFHRKCGDKDFKCTSWVRNENFGHTRNVSFQHPIKLYFGARFGSCHETQKYCVYRNSHLVIETSQDISDVPYSDYFSVEGRWDVEEDGNDSKPGCILRVYTNVAFSKKTMWKGKIVQSTIEECREAYATWTELAHEVLKQKNLEKRQDEQVRLATPEKTPEHVEPETLNVQTQSVPDVVTNEQANHYPQESLGNGSVGSLLTGGFSKITASLKRQNAPTLLLVISLAIILLLMQISILTLLSRPQRIVMIPQSSDYTSENSRETAASSLNRQIKYLKEEMEFVETMLDRLQKEHGRLKGKLRELEVFRN